MNLSSLVLTLLIGLSILSARAESVRETLESLHEADQANRLKLQEMEFGSEEWKELWKIQTAIDEENTKQLESILLEHGWPKRSEVGLKASNTAFLILQHAKPETQKKYVDLLREAVAEDEADPSFLALLEDRILMHDGKPQIYGSQVQSDTEGNLQVWPIENEDQVNERRAEVGLEPLEDYLARFGIEYKKEANKSAHTTPAIAPR